MSSSCRPESKNTSVSRLALLDFLRALSCGKPYVAEPLICDRACVTSCIVVFALPFVGMVLCKQASYFLSMFITEIVFLVFVSILRDSY